MPAKDIYHNARVHALQKDGWTITHDPLTISVGKTDLLIDLGAERVVAAEREGERIAVEIKSFVKLRSRLTSPIHYGGFARKYAPYYLCFKARAKSSCWPRGI